MAFEPDKPARRRLRIDYMSVGHMLVRAKADRDRVSSFVIGADMQSADSIVFVVKGGTLSRQLYDEFVARGLITADNAVVDWN